MIHHHREAPQHSEKQSNLYDMGARLLDRAVQVSSPIELLMLTNPSLIGRELQALILGVRPATFMFDLEGIALGLLQKVDAKTFKKVGNFILNVPATRLRLQMYPEPFPELHLLAEQGSDENLLTKITEFSGKEFPKVYQYYTLINNLSSQAEEMKKKKQSFTELLAMLERSYSETTESEDYSKYQASEALVGFLAGYPVEDALAYASYEMRLRTLYAIKTLVDGKAVEVDELTRHFFKDIDVFKSLEKRKKAVGEIGERFQNSFLDNLLSSVLVERADFYGFQYAITSGDKEATKELQKESKLAFSRLPMGSLQLKFVEHLPLSILRTVLGVFRQHPRD